MSSSHSIRITGFPGLVLSLLPLLPLLFTLPPTLEAQTRNTASAPAGPPPSELKERVERFTQDRAVLLRFHDLDSADRRERMASFYRTWQSDLEALDFDALTVEARIDWVLLQNRLRYELERLEVAGELAAERERLLPFDSVVTALHEERRRLLAVDPEGAADRLHAATGQIAEARKRVGVALGDGEALDGQGTPGGGETLDGMELTPVTVLRAVNRARDLRRTTREWYEHFHGYDPLFTWWVATPFEAFDEALGDYIRFLEARGMGVGEEDEPIIGDPLGRDALLLDLRNELIAYTPEELLEIARHELEWGEARMREAAAELGFGDDIHAALEHVKGLHVEPGEQIHLVTELAREAEAFLEERDLLTVPPLAREVWRMNMLSPEMQRIAPFFLGGEVVRVAFPTDGMSHEEKRMSLRANNEHFSRAVVHHELIPGHHLQGFMTARYGTHRNAFSTPFWGEGWALYWELLLWDLDFARGPEDRIGMLFWRNHRAARILFSLAFHMEEMTPEEAIDLLVERVGHEPSTAEAEVRRSFLGTYPPLYQAAYLLGGLQLQALRRELVDTGHMTDRDFHDHILRAGRIPIEMVRASLTGEAPPRDFEPRWRFHPAVP
ncbi:MAG: DUF885 family protein [Gemmatimonadales bacterium]|nr:MAG: DUF885 family protein [Gemmatimonadales bacterium]